LVYCKINPTESKQKNSVDTIEYVAVHGQSSWTSAKL